MGNYNFSWPTLTNVTFSGNSASNNGGGMYNEYSRPTLTNVTFSGNSANNGGGMYNKEESLSGNPRLTNVIFSNNSANSRGGGMYNDNINPELRDVTFSGNSANSNGGGMYNWKSSPSLVNIIFSSNSANNGGGVFNTQNSNPVLTNVVFNGNAANNGSGGGMYNDYSNPTLTNVTFSGNSATESGGGIHNFYSNPALRNLIMWGDNAPTGPELRNENSTPTISYSNIRGCGGSVGWNSACGTNGGGNIDRDPLFADPAAGDLHLRLASPCIDAGDKTAVPAGITTDLDGNPRFVNVPFIPDTGRGTPPIVDMGAYEARPLQVYLPLVMRKR